MPRHRGVIWEHFTTEVDIEKNSAKCNLYKKLLQVNDYNTSGLRKYLKNAHPRDFQDIEKKKAPQKRKADEANEELELVHNKESEDEESEEKSPAFLLPTVKKYRFSAKSINFYKVKN